MATDRSRILPIGALTLFAALVAAPTPARALGFEAALRKAEATAPSLTAGAAREAAALEAAGAADALPDPRLTLGISDWPITGPDAFDLRAEDMTSQQIGLMQEFPARAKRRAQRALALAQAAQAQALTQAERAAVRQRAAQAWFELWSAQAQRAALESLREAADIAERTAEARLAGGSGSVSETLGIKAAALALDNRIDAAQGAVEAAAAGLARWLGGEAPGELAADGALPDLRQLRVPQERLFEALDRLAPLRVWRGAEAVASAEVEAALAQRQPDWGLSLNYGRRDRAPDGMARSDMLMLEVSIGLPLFTRQRQDHQIAARRAELDATLAARDDARREQREALRRQLAQWQSLTRQLDRLEREALPLARDRSAVALAAYGAGGELQPWLDARRDEIELVIEHARLQGELGRAWAALAWLLPDEETTP